MKMKRIGVFLLVAVMIAATFTTIALAEPSGRTFTSKNYPSSHPDRVRISAGPGGYIEEDTNVDGEFNGGNEVWTFYAHGLPGFAFDHWELTNSGQVTDIKDTTYKLSFKRNGGALNGNGAKYFGAQAVFVGVNTAPVVTQDPSNAVITYGSDATFSAAATGTPAPAVQWQVNTGSGWSDVSGATSTTLTLTGPTVAMSGYRYQAVFTNSEGSATTDDATLTVNKATATVTLSGLGTYTFNGSARVVTASTEGPSGLTVGVTYNGSATAPTNAGTYTVVGTINDLNYQGSATGDLVINKAGATVTLNSADLAQTFDGTAKAVRTSTNPAGLAVDVTYDGDSAAPTNAGSYTVVGTINDANYEGSVTGTLVIGKANARIKVKGKTTTFNGDEHGASGTARGADGSDLSGLLDFGDKFINAPGGTASWTFAGDDNHFGDCGSVKIVIKRAKATINVSGARTIFDGSEHGASGKATGADGSDLSGLLDFGDKFTNAPGGMAHWTFAGDGNHKAAKGSVRIRIGKANATISVSGAAVPYDGDAHGATGEAKGVKGEDLGSWLDLGASFTGAPGGTANWSFAGHNNYNKVSGSVEIIIEKVDADIDVAGKTVIYDGDAHGATGEAKGVKGEDLSGLLDLGATFTSAPGGTASWTFAGNGNYNGADGEVDIDIDKADATVNVAGKAVTYDGSAQGATGTATGVKGEDLSGLLNLGGTFTNVPGGTAYWAFAGNNNYNAANGSVQIIINKAPAGMTLGGLRRTYDGNRKAVTAAVDPDGLNVAITYNGFVIAPRDIGRYTVVGTVVDDNYVGSATGTLVISEEVVPTHALTVTIVGQGTTGLSSGTYEEGEIVLLGPVSATPAEGYQFVGWQDADGNPITSVAIGADTEIFAVFSQIEELPGEPLPAAGNGDDDEGDDQGQGTLLEGEPIPGAQGNGWMWWLLLLIPAGLLIWLLIYAARRRRQTDEA